jgi:hypothetical protein
MARKAESAASVDVCIINDMSATRTAWHDLAEAWMIFSMEGPVWGTLRRAHAALDDAEIPHAVVGGLAVFLHGHRRMTTDVDVLVRPQDVACVIDALRDAGMERKKGEFIGDEDVRMHLLITGEPEGIDWAKAIHFPDPVDARVVETIDDFPTVVLARILEMKLACGLSNPRRPRDIDDALRLMEVHELDKRFVTRLHPLLRKDFKRLVDVIRRYPGSHGPA